KYANRNADQNPTMSTEDKTNAKNTVANATVDNPDSITKATDATNADGYKPQAKTLIDNLNYLTKEQKDAAKKKIDDAPTNAAIDQIVKDYANTNTTPNTTQTEGEKAATREKINNSETSPADAVTASNREGLKDKADKALEAIKNLKYLTTTGDNNDIAQATEELKQVTDPAKIDEIFKKYANRNADQNPTMSTEDKNAAKETADKATFSDPSTITAATDETNADGYKVTAKEYIDNLNYLTPEQKKAAKDKIDEAGTASVDQINAVVKDYSLTNTDQNTTQTEGEKAATRDKINASGTPVSDMVDASNREGLKKKADDALAAIEKLKYLTTGDNSDIAAATEELKKVTSEDQIDEIFKKYAKRNADQNPTMSTEDKEAAKETADKATFNDAESITAATDETNADGYKVTAKQYIDNLKYLTEDQRIAAKQLIDEPATASVNQINAVVKNYALTNTDQNPTQTEGQKAVTKANIENSSTTVTEAVDDSNRDGIQEDVIKAIAALKKLKYLTTDGSDSDQAQAIAELNKVTTKAEIDEIFKKYAKRNADQNTTKTDAEKEAAKEVADKASFTDADSITAATDETNADGYKVTAKGYIDQLKYLTPEQKEAAKQLIDSKTTKDDMDQIVRDNALINVDQNTTMTPGDRVVAKNEIASESAPDAVVTSNEDGNADAADVANALIDNMKYLTPEQIAAAKTAVANAQSKDEIDQAVKDAARTNTNQNTTMSTEDKQRTTALIDSDAPVAQGVAASNEDGEKVPAKALINKLNYLTPEEKEAYKQEIDAASTLTSADILAVVKKAATDNTDANPTLTDAEKAETKSDIALTTTTGGVAVDESNEIGENGDLDDIKEAAKKYIDTLTNLTDAEKTALKNQVDNGTDYNSVLEVAKQAARDDINGSTYAAPSDLADALSQVESATGLKGLKSATTEAVKVDASALIDKLTNLTEEQRQELKEKLENADSTPAAITIAKNAVRQDIGTMAQRTGSSDTSDVDDATNIAQLGKSDLTALIEDATAAVDKMANLTEAQKAAAKAAIAASGSTTEVITALTSAAGTNVTTLPTPGTAPTGTTVADILNQSLVDFKTAAKNAIDNLPNLTAEEKATAKASVDAATNEVSALATVKNATTTDVSRLQNLSDAEKQAALAKIAGDTTLTDTVADDITDAKLDATNRINKLPNISAEQKAEYLNKVATATTAGAALEESTTAKATDDEILATAMAHAREAIARAESVLDKVVYTNSGSTKSTNFNTLRQQLTDLLTAAANGEITAAELEAKLAELTEAQEELDGTEPTKKSINWPLIGGAAVGIAALGAGIAALGDRNSEPAAHAASQAPANAGASNPATGEVSNGVDAQANAGTQQNATGQTHANGVSALARTGADSYSPIFWGMVLMLLGGAAFAAGRRRRPLVAGGRHQRDENEAGVHPLIEMARTRFGARLPRRHSKDS
ncbi:MAG: hypothetical protein Q3972_05785, partial [Corynebacterium sp.]|nr:hypothetical protein [Corynebacterium sp.]